MVRQRNTVKWRDKPVFIGHRSGRGIEKAIEDDAAELSDPHSDDQRVQRQEWLIVIGLTMNPRVLPSVLIGRPVPKFDLPQVEGRQLGLSISDLVGEASMLNVFGSWCTACRAEHPLLMRLASRGTVPIHGLN